MAESRVQLALNVSDLEASIAFYSRLFGVEVHKRRTGYANFVVEHPPLKLVLIEVPADERGDGVQGALNHLGVECLDPADVPAHVDRLRAAGLVSVEEQDTTCCFALQDKVWAHDPAGVPWEYYAVKDDNPIGLEMLTLAETSAGCCVPSNASAGAQSTCC